jgi:NitT/TauT family transport system permease protein
MMRTWRPVMLPIAFVIALVVLVQWLIGVLRISPLLLPLPSAVWSQLIGAWPVLVAQAVPTASDAVGGYVIGAVLGIAIGVSLVSSRHVEQSFWPYVLIFQLIPKVALAPLFIIWLGVGPSSRLAFAVFLSFFPTTIATVQGLRAADPVVLRLCTSLLATPRQVFMKVRLVYALSYLFAGLRVAVTSAMIGVIVGEFVTAQQGLGYIIIYAVSAGQSALAFAAIVLVCGIGLILYGIVALSEYLVCKRFHVPMSSTGF